MSKGNTVWTFEDVDGEIWDVKGVPQLAEAKVAARNAGARGSLKLIDVKGNKTLMELFREARK